VLPFDLFSSALPYDAFLSHFGTPADRENWDRVRAATELTAEQKTLLGTFVRNAPVLVLAGAWCGDCANQCPIFERFAEMAPVLDVRYLDRDAFPAAQNELKINGGNRVPVVVFYSEDGFEVARYGERTLSTYRRMGAADEGRPAPPVDRLAAATQEWLDEFERVQLILRLSPRLKRLHPAETRHKV
jgi:thiol-disulfide isomerase/thioredoxin